MQRFLRVRHLLGEQGLLHLQSSSVTVVGLGAVGGHVVEGLVRSGVGRLRLVDFDTVQPTNINRQILALESTLGRAKVEVARERALEINPDCIVESLQIVAREDTTPEIMDPAPDLLVDAIDSLNPKVGLLTAAYHLGIPTISAMGAALRTDPTQVQFGDIFETKNCPLARRLRGRLRRNGVGEGITCVFSTEKVDFDYRDPPGEESGDINAPEVHGRKRNVLGSLPTLTGIFGLIIANEAILRLSRQNQP